MISLLHEIDFYGISEMSGRLSMCAKLSDESCGGIHFSELLHPQCAKNDPVLAIDGNGPMMVVAHTKRLNLFGFDEHHGWNLKVKFCSSNITLKKFCGTPSFERSLGCQNFFFFGPLTQKQLNFYFKATQVISSRPDRVSLKFNAQKKTRDVCYISYSHKATIKLFKVIDDCMIEVEGERFLAIFYSCD